MIRRLIALAAVVSVMGCGLTKQTAPSLSGPASFGVTLAVTASPDVLVQDGSAASFIQVVATDANNQPIPNLPVRVDTLVGGTAVDLGTLSTKSFTTSASGRGTVVYTSPAPPSPLAPADIIVTLAFTPVGQDFSNALPRTVEIRLARPNPQPPADDLRAAFTFSPFSPKVGDIVQFDASTSQVGPGRGIVAYSWTFADDGSTAGQKVTHVFGSSGVIEVTLTVTDDIGRTSTTMQLITVASAPVAAPDSELRDSSDDRPAPSHS